MGDSAKSDLISVLARPPSLVAKIKFNVITLQHVFVVALIPSSGHSQTCEQTHECNLVVIKLLATTIGCISHFTAIFKQ